MLSSAAKRFQTSDLPNFLPVSGSSSTGTHGPTSPRTSFYALLERVSANEIRTGRAKNGQGEPPNGRNGADKADTRTLEVRDVRQDRVADLGSDRMDKKKNAQQNPQAGAQSGQGAARICHSSESESASSAAVQQERDTETSNRDNVQKDYATITIPMKDSGDDVKVSLNGLSEELLNALLSACGNGTDVARLISLADAKGQNNQQGTDDGINQDNTESNEPDKASGHLFVRDDSLKLTVKLSADQSDVSTCVKEVLSFIQAVVGALQGETPDTMAPESDLKGIPAVATSNQRALEALSALLSKQMPFQAPSLHPASASIFKDLLSSLVLQDAASTDEQSGNRIGANVIPDNTLELKLSTGTDNNVTEFVIAKIKSALSLPAATAEVSGAPQKTEDVPPRQSNGDGGLEGGSAWTQTNIQHSEPSAGTSSATSFGSIVADRLAAVAEQVAAREKPLDITLRLRMENGESLMVGLKDQAGKIIVQVKSADQSMIGFLESQKDTIVRNLEAKQVSSTISVSAIEEDLTRKQGREQQSRSTWGNRRQPPNPFIETSI